MDDHSDRLATALADRYRIEGGLGRAARLLAPHGPSRGAAQAACFRHPSDQNRVSRVAGRPGENPGWPATFYLG